MNSSSAIRAVASGRYWSHSLGIAPRLRRLFQRAASITKIRNPTAEATIARYKFWRWNDSTERLLNDHLIGLRNKSFTVE